MIQFNLLPDVKIEYIKTRYRKRLIMFISAIITAACLAIFVILFLFVRVNQTREIKNLDKDIKTNVTKVQSIQDLDKILTIQNQLNSLPELHDKKVVASRLSDYLTKITPNQATISDVAVDFEGSTMTITGNAVDIIVINKFVDTVKFTEYKVAGSDSSQKAFKNVVLASYTIPDGTGSSDKAAYSITFSFEPAIFTQVATENNQEAVTLTVPKITSTRSETEKPANLFESQPQKKEGQ